MNKKMLKEILAAHADHLVTGQAKSKDYLNLLADSEAELAPLLDVAERVKSTLKPIKPARKFEKELKQGLMTTAHLRRAEGYVGRVFTLDKPIVDGVGTIRIEDTVWRVSGPNLPAGSRVKVVQADGASLTVAAA